MCGIVGYVGKKINIKNAILALKKLEYRGYDSSGIAFINKKQIEFHKCKKRNRWVFGGNRSGKTECGAVEVVYLARGIHPYKSNKKSVEGWVVSLSSQVGRDVAQKKILSYLNPDWIEDIVMTAGRKDFPGHNF